MTKKSVFKNQKGVALIVLLSFVMTMGPMTLYMMDDSLKNHQVTLNTVSRLKSFYLAKSALNFSKLILYYSKLVDKKVGESGVSANQIGGLAEPLYRQFPLDTEIFRAILSGGASSFLDDAEATDPEEGADPTLAEDIDAAAVSRFDQDIADEFLSFDGNFYAEIGEENAKYSVNALAKLESGFAAYDIYKKLLLQILMNEDLKPAFDDQEKDAEALVHAIGDYIDANSSINEFDGRERGSEDSEYGGLEHRPKNAKFLSLSELRLVPGMNDRVFAALAPLLTVYHTESTLNLCLADEALLENLILLYAEHADCTKSLNIRDEDELAEVAATVLAFCPDKEDMANALNVALGLKEAEETGLDFGDVTTGTASTGSSDTAGKSAKVAECKLQFVDFLNEKNDIFTINAVGEVGDVKTQIKVVLDASATSPKGWKVLNYRTE